MRRLNLISALLLLCLNHPVIAADSNSSGGELKESFSALGHAFANFGKQVGSTAKEAGVATFETAKNVGKEVGHTAVKAGGEVGNAAVTNGSEALQQGSAVGSGITGWMANTCKKVGGAFDRFSARLKQATGPSSKAVPTPND